MTTEYFLVVGGQRRGPYTLEQLPNEPLTADTLVWQRGLSGWVKAGTVPDLQLLLARLPPPLPITTSAPTPLPPALPPSPSTIRDHGASASDTPLTNARLPFMGNVICVYCLLVGPLLWLLNHLACCVTGPSYHEGTPFFGLELLLALATAVTSLGVTVTLVVGGLRLRALQPSAPPLVRYGFYAAVALDVFWFVIGALLTIVAHLAADNPFAESTPAQVVVSLFMFAVNLAEFAFLVVAAVWLTTDASLSALTHAANRSEKPGDPSSGRDDGTTGRDASGATEPRPRPPFPGHGGQGKQPGPRPSPRPEGKRAVVEPPPLPPVNAPPAGPTPAEPAPERQSLAKQIGAGTAAVLMGVAAFGRLLKGCDNAKHHRQPSAKSAPASPGQQSPYRP